MSGTRRLTPDTLSLKGILLLDDAFRFDSTVLVFSPLAKRQAANTIPLAITMDPASGLGLAASVVQLIQFAVKSIEFLSDVYHASEDQPQLLQEASSVLPVLFALKSRLAQSSQDEPWSIGIRALGVASGPLDQLGQALMTIAQKLQPTNGVTKLLRTAKWPFDKKTCREMLGRMERAKSSIGLALQNDQIFVSLRNPCTH
ncbi:MAG: hypothetical protein Q9212_006823 [Teloschistes hypoglaucus]